MLSRRLTETEQCGLIAQSSLFDAQWYCAQNPDVCYSGLDPVLHYVRHGESEGRNPGPNFHLDECLPRPCGTGNILCDEILAAGNRQACSNAIPVFFATNENYVPYLSVAIASLIRSAAKDRHYVAHVLYNDLSEESLAILSSQSTSQVVVEPVCVKKQVESIVNNCYVNNHYSSEMYFRLLIPSLFSEYSKSIYLDCDLVVNADLGALYVIDMHETMLGAIQEQTRRPWLFPYCKDKLNISVEDYFNSGVLLINHNMLKGKEFLDACLHHVSRNIQLACPDQDILNLVCHGKVKLLPYTWNCMWYFYIGETYKFAPIHVFREYARCFKHPAVAHFNSPVKPWHQDDGHFARMFWNHARFSPYFERIRQECAYPVDEIIARLEAVEA